MRFLFAAGDVGGARALLPVARLAAAEGEAVAALAHGSFRTEGAPEWHWLKPGEAAAHSAKVDVVLYATSVADPLAVEIAGRAHAAGRPVIHLLDNWSSYAARISSLVPDAYAVMDDLAAEEAAAAGVPAGILAVTGHPGLAKIARERAEFGGTGPAAPGRRLLFVSEPAAADGGRNGRGYDEAKVARALVEGIASASMGGAELALQVAPHPREDRDTVCARFATLCATIPGAPRVSIVGPSEVRRTLHAASHVAGMSSILLYEAWLLGRPTLSLQPGLIGKGLRTLARRDGVIFHVAPQGTAAAVAEWIARTPRDPMPDLGQHENAARTVLALARNLAARQT